MKRKTRKASRNCGDFFLVFIETLILQSGELRAEKTVREVLLAGLDARAFMRYDASSFSSTHLVRTMKKGFDGPGQTPFARNESRAIQSPYSQIVVDEGI